MTSGSITIYGAGNDHGKTAPSTRFGMSSEGIITI